ncbi:hypothetical protein ACP26L_15865 [Paenibacillus sp. S-38]|uniref:hypothetical protein n=1 Tax=Paenibacillus sp. S-38 TaxID=3416710 RepID=UPI003CF40C0A
MENTHNQLQEEYEFRQVLISEIDKRINSFFVDYERFYSGEIGILLIYPLLALEERYFELERASRLPDIDNERNAICWFIGNVLNRYDLRNLNYDFDIEAYTYFKNNLYELIRVVWSDYEYKKALRDMNSYGKLMVEIDGSNVFIKLPTIKNEILDKRIYQSGIYDSEEKKVETAFAGTLIFYLHSLSPEDLKNISEFKNKDFIELCIKRVNLDFQRIGGSITSMYIENYDNLVRFVGLLFSVSYCINYIKWYNRIPIDYIDLVKMYEKKKFIDQVVKTIKVPRNQIEQFIEYFSFSQLELEGASFHEFPLVLIQDKIIFNPTSFRINDWHFTIPNGHYFKKVTIPNQKKTMSQSIVNLIVERVKKIPNIVCRWDKNYHKVANEQNLSGSDIDLALYDIEKNVLLIIECKWQANLYSPLLNYTRAYRVLKDGYSKQLAVHKEFLSNPQNIDYIFDEDERVKKLSGQVEIHYMMLDKRLQLHINEMHIITAYMLLSLMDRYIVGGKLKLDRLIRKVYSLQTTVEYRENVFVNEFELSNYQVKAEGLYLQYFNELVAFLGKDIKNMGLRDCGFNTIYYSSVDGEIVESNKSLLINDEDKTDLLGNTFNNYVNMQTRAGWCMIDYPLNGYYITFTGRVAIPRSILKYEIEGKMELFLDDNLVYTYEINKEAEPDDLELNIVNINKLSIKLQSKDLASISIFNLKLLY